MRSTTSPRVCVALLLLIKLPGHLGHLFEKPNRRGTEKQNIALQFISEYIYELQWINHIRKFFR
jgi:hypothetical protein